MEHIIIKKVLENNADVECVKYDGKVGFQTEEFCNTDNIEMYQKYGTKSFVAACEHCTRIANALESLVLLALSCR